MREGERSRPGVREWGVSEDGVRGWGVNDRGQYERRECVREGGTDGVCL